MIEAVLISDANGIPIFKNFFTKQFVDPDLILSFFSALKSFAKSMSEESSNELRSISFGKYAFNFESAEFEQIGQEVDVLLISTGIPPSACHALVSEITELFTLFLEEFIVENPASQKQIKNAQYPNFSNFSIELSSIMSKISLTKDFQMQSTSNIPNVAFSTITQLFQDNQILAEMYDFSEQQLIEQFLNGYCKNKLTKDILRKFQIEKVSKFNPWD